MSPDRIPEVMNNLAAAATQLNAHVMMQMMQTEEDPDSGGGIVRGHAGAFDDVKVAQLLATALALDGSASDRLATIFNAIAPDEDRKRRVLTMTRSLLTETDFGKTGQFQVLWTSMEELLISYNAFRPQVKIISNGKGEMLKEPLLANTWERDGRGEHLRAVVEAIDPETMGIDPLTYL